VGEDSEFSSRENWPTLFERSNGIWYIVTTIEGRRAWKSTGAFRKANAFRALRSTDTVPKKPTEKPPKTFDGFLKEYLEYLRVSHQPKTHEMYARVGRNFQSMVGQKNLKALNAKCWDDYAVRRAPHVSAATINIEQRTLKTMMNKAVEWDYLPASPFAKVKKIRVVEIPPKYFTRGEFDRLIGLIKEPWLKDAALFSIATGIRQGELVNLRWTEVDLVRRVIMIQSSSTFRVKGNKARVVPLSSLALDVLQRQSAHPMCPYVFHKNWRKLDGNWMSGLFRRYVKKAGLYEKKLHWHNLRASFASWLVSSGVSLFAVSNLLGHSTTTLTQRHYARLVPETLHSAVELIKGDLSEIEAK